MSDEAANTTPAPAMVNVSLRCSSCDYDLRGLPLAGVCPECNAYIALSELAARSRAQFFKRPRLLIAGLVAHVAALGIVLAAAASLFAQSTLGIVLTILAGIVFVAGSAMLASAGPLSRRSETLTVAACIFSPVLLIAAAVLLQRENVALLLTLMLGAGLNFVQLVAIAVVHRRAADAIGRAGKSTRGRVFMALTIAWHGLCLVWVLAICGTGLLNEDLAIVLGSTYLYTLPVHGLWLVWLTIRSLVLALQIKQYLSADVGVGHTGAKLGE